MDAGRLCRTWGFGLGLFFAAPLGYLVYENVRLRTDILDILGVARTWGPLGNSLLLATSVSLAAMVAGTALAWATVRLDLPGRRLWAALAPLPLVFPTFVGATAFIALGARGGLAEQILSPLGVGALPRLQGFWAAWGVLTLFTYPYVYLPTRARLRHLDPAYEEAARVLGRGRRAVFATVTLPAILPATSAGGCWYAPTPSRTSSRSSCSLRDPHPFYLCHPALRPAHTVNHGLLLGIGGGGRDGHTGSHGAARGASPRPFQPAPPLGAARLVGAGGLRRRRRIPPPGSRGPARHAGILGRKGDRQSRQARRSFALDGGESPPRPPPRWRQRGCGHSSVGVMSRWRGSWSPPVAQRLGLQSPCHRGFRLPGIVVALALVFWALQVPFATVIYQTLPLLKSAMCSCSARRRQPARAAVGAVPTRLSEGARTLGARRWRRLRSVELPLMAPGLLAAGGLVFLSVMKELPLTLLMRPTNLPMLSADIWDSTESLFLAQAGLESLVLVGASGLLTWLLVLRRSEFA